ncbi:MAG TPA: glucose-6-phosphate isomerase family protein [Caldisericia bacterium]|nr:glucose-6-phosphate isomerase family protein [Caldisericia bacterium]HPF49369.1 glucose-6-phosphate isomerase family protein [Caldisericia bacterium]HPI84445.1 glucose-6-phosphate isomerase family protein [Caldisericia bacterium]HPQ93794.1 glucose-6-phosphate isomerase family protein [Caldisericia bacterium]HRV75642.1 glucose-6-phosphate isomerase family protein [Caldisericia bacterium]
MTLTDIAGLPLELDVEGCEVSFPGVDICPEYSERIFSKAKQFYLDGCSDGDRVLYKMWRDVHLPEHEELIRNSKLRYDIVLICSGQVGREYIKTIGHYHPKADEDEAYPEIYEVLHGEGVLLLQDENIADAIAVPVKAGNQVFIPPGYGHISINTGDECLVFSNILSDYFTSVYGVMEKNCGGVYYLTKSEGGPEWIENPNYQKHPTLRTLGPGQMPMIVGLSGPLYTNLIEDPFRFACLKNPRLCPSF